MLRYLIVFLLALPFLDFYVLLETSRIIGIIPTLGFILATGLIGAALIKKEGTNIMRKLGTAVTAKEISRSLIEGALLVFGGLTLLTPGFVTDIIGFMMVIRYTRERIMLHLSRKLESNAQFEIRTF